MAVGLDTIKQRIAPVAKGYGLPAVYVFGSYATNTATETSDLDLLVDTTYTALNSLFKLGALYADFEEALGMRIDMITVDSLEQPARTKLDKEFKTQVMRERVPVYGIS